MLTAFAIFFAKFAVSVVVLALTYRASQRYRIEVSKR